MRTFLNVPILDINCTCRMFAHHSFVILFTKLTMFSYSEQVEDIHMVQELEMILSQKIVQLNVSNGYSMYIDYK